MSYRSASCDKTTHCKVPSTERCKVQEPQGSSTKDKVVAAPSTHQNPEVIGGIKLSAQNAVNLSTMEQEVQIHKVESCKKANEDKSDNELKTEELFKRARYILHHKLTPKNFLTLVKQMAELEITSEEHLKGVVQLVYEKGINIKKPIDESQDTVAYAAMSRYLTQIKVKSDSKPGEQVNFRAILLTRCQREFERDKTNDEGIQKMKAQLEEAAEEKKTQIEKEIKLAETDNRRRSVGNIRFIGELFKLKMLAAPIIHECVFKLLNNKDELSLECVCALLTTTGKELDTDYAKPRVDQYFQRLNKIVEEKKTSSRVRFMLQDIIELRQGSRNLDVQRSARMVSGQLGLGGGGSHGWYTHRSGRPNLRGERQTIDPSRLKISRQNINEDMQYGPGGRDARFPGWGRASSGRGSKSSQWQVNNARGHRSIAGGQTPREKTSIGSSGGREPRNSAFKEPGVAAPLTNQLSEDEMVKKTDAILDEYLHIQDIKEALQCVEELNSPSTLHVFVSECIYLVLERSNVARRQTGLLLHDLVRKNIISVKQYLQGLRTVFGYAEDMEIDIPKIWQYFGELLGPMVQDDSVPLSFLKEACEPLKESGKAGILMAEILHDASDREGYKKVGDLWRKSGLEWSDFVPKEKITQFLKDKKLDFTRGDGSLASAPKVRIDKIQLHLQDLIFNSSKNEEVIDWIEENVDIVTARDKNFIRALMTAVCSSAITGTYIGNIVKVDPLKVTQRAAVLLKYLDHSAEFELQALYALQALVHKLEHPPGVLRTLFDTLYDEDIISEVAFNQWETSKDPAEQEGKGVAMKHVVQFFTWIREADGDVDSCE